MVGNGKHLLAPQYICEHSSTFCKCKWGFIHPTFFFSRFQLPPAPPYQYLFMLVASVADCRVGGYVSLNLTWTLGRQGREGGLQVQVINKVSNGKTLSDIQPLHI